MTLLEVMVVVAIIGVLSSLAVPNLLHVVNDAKLSSDAQAAAAWVDLVRRRAHAEKRCFRITASGTVLRADRRNSPDCVNLAEDGWELDTLVFRSEGSSVSVEGLPAALPLDERLILRPNGRLRGDGDLIVTDDIARIVLQRPAVAGSRVVLVTPLARICPLSFPAAAPTLTTSDTCL